MKVLIVGASGLIGSAIAARLASEGHEIVAVARHPPQNSFPPAAWIALDLARATDPNDWTAVLAGIEAVVNCAGVLQDGPGDSTAGVHTSGPAALFRACERQGIRRVIHLSAVGADVSLAAVGHLRGLRVLTPDVVWAHDSQFPERDQYRFYALQQKTKSPN